MHGQTRNSLYRRVQVNSLNRQAHMLIYSWEVVAQERPKVSSLALAGIQGMYAVINLKLVMHMISNKVFRPEIKYLPYYHNYLSTGRETRGATELSQLHQRLKPRPRWCPTGLTHTQKRRVQRLRAFEMKEEIVEKKRLFDEEKLMVPKITWREKHIVGEKLPKAPNGKYSKKYCHSMSKKT